MKAEILARPKLATKPPTRWRNWWRAPETYYWRCSACGGTGVTERGTVEADHCLTYPSKDLAETMGSSDSPHYVGAFPEGERP